MRFEAVVIWRGAWVDDVKQSIMLVWPILKGCITNQQRFCVYTVLLAETVHFFCYFCVIICPKQKVIST